MVGTDLNERVSQGGELGSCAAMPTNSVKLQRAAAKSRTEGENMVSDG